jgi:hypothetical protein
MLSNLHGLHSRFAEEISKAIEPEERPTDLDLREHVAAGLTVIFAL